jgi:hypothetical protein
MTAHAHQSSSAGCVTVTAAGSLPRSSPEFCHSVLPRSGQLARTSGLVTIGLHPRNGGLERRVRREQSDDILAPAARRTDAAKPRQTFSQLLTHCEMRPIQQNEQAAAGKCPPSPVAEVWKKPKSAMQPTNKATRTSATMESCARNQGRPQRPLVFIAFGGADSSTFGRKVF